MKLGEFLLNEKTKVSLNIINFVVLVGFVVTASFTFATWKTEAEAIDRALDVRITNEIRERVDADEDIKQEQKEISLKMSEIQNGQTELKIGMARIEVNILRLLEINEKDD